MKILATYNIKGGVGKTATAVNLAYVAARRGARVLVWDLDPQGASSFYFRIKPKLKGGSEKIIHRRAELSGVIKGSDFDNLDLIPSDISLRNLDLVLDNEKKPIKQLKKVLKPIAEDYEYVFLDCPPGISLLSESVFEAANALISPVIPTTLSLRTLQQLQKFIETNSLDKLQLVPFFSMVDRRKKLHCEILERRPDHCLHILASYIPYASEIERMGLERAPIGQFSRSSKSANAYESLWSEILETLV